MTDPRSPLPAGTDHVPAAGSDHAPPLPAAGPAGAGDPDTAPIPSRTGAHLTLPAATAELFSPERLEAQYEAFWHGRRIAELSDSELAAALAGEPEEPPPEPPPARSAANWRKLAVTWPEPRVSMTLRLDESVVAWFRRAGRGYQARMNAVLRAYVDAQRAEEQKRQR